MQRRVRLSSGIGATRPDVDRPESHLRHLEGRIAHRRAPSPNGDTHLVRSDVLGRVFAVSLHDAIDLCLHGSAAALDGRGIVLVGSKGHGKSTLAMALVAAGARYVADDAARLTNCPPRVAAGVPALRLRGDSAAHFGVVSIVGTVGDKGCRPRPRRWRRGATLASSRRYLHCRAPTCASSCSRGHAPPPE